MTPERLLHIMKEDPRKLIWLGEGQVAIPALLLAISRDNATDNFYACFIRKDEDLGGVVRISSNLSACQELNAWIEESGGIKEAKL